MHSAHPRGIAAFLWKRRFACITVGLLILLGSVITALYVLPRTVRLSGTVHGHWTWAVDGKRIRVYSLQDAEDERVARQIVKRFKEAPYCTAMGYVTGTPNKFEAPEEAIVERQRYSCRVNLGKKLLVLSVKGGDWIEIVDVQGDTTCDFNESNAVPCQ